MKKVLLALALVASLSVANAQTGGKSPEAAKKHTTHKESK